mgnify:CR=1 FL=1
MASSGSVGTLSWSAKLDSNEFKKGVRKVKKQMKEAQKSVTESLKVISSGFAIATGAVVGMTGALGAMTKQTAESVKEIENLSRVADTTFNEFIKMSEGAKKYGVEQDKLADILKDTYGIEPAAADRTLELQETSPAPDPRRHGAQTSDPHRCDPGRALCGHRARLLRGHPRGLADRSGGCRRGPPGHADPRRHPDHAGDRPQTTAGDWRQTRARTVRYGPTLVCEAHDRPGPGGRTAHAAAVSRHSLGRPGHAEHHARHGQRTPRRRRPSCKCLRQPC